MSKANGYWYTIDYRVRLKKKVVLSSANAEDDKGPQHVAT
jgi:hypothetical protein